MWDAVCGDRRSVPKVSAVLRSHPATSSPRTRGRRELGGGAGISGSDAHGRQLGVALAVAHNWPRRVQPEHLPRVGRRCGGPWVRGQTLRTHAHGMRSLSGRQTSDSCAFVPVTHTQSQEDADRIVYQHEHVTDEPMWHDRRRSCAARAVIGTRAIARSIPVPTTRSSAQTAGAHRAARRRGGRAQKPRAAHAVAAVARTARHSTGGAQEAERTRRCKGVRSHNPH